MKLFIALFVLLNSFSAFAERNADCNGKVVITHNFPYAFTEERSTRVYLNDVDMQRLNIILVETGEHFRVLNKFRNGDDLNYFSASHMDETERVRVILPVMALIGVPRNLTIIARISRLTEDQRIALFEDYTVTCNFTISY